MDPGSFFASSRVLIVAGKGGVGKTAAAATIAVAAARTGRSVLLVEVSGRSAAAPLLGAEPQGYEETDVVDDVGVPTSIRCRSLTPDQALVEWLADHGFRRIAKRMARSGVLEVVATATPGIKDLLVLGKIRQLETTGAADLIVVDAPAAGHALGFLRSPAGVLDTARAGTIHRQADEALAFLSSPSRCRVMLVSIPEETPVNELVETSFAVEDEVGITLGPVIVNSVLPRIPNLDPTKIRRPHSGDISDLELDEIRAAARFRIARTDLQHRQLVRLADQLPLPQIRLPQLFVPSLGPAEIEQLADAMTVGIEAIKDRP